MDYNDAEHETDVEFVDIRNIKRDSVAKTERGPSVNKLTNNTVSQSGVRKPKKKQKLKFKQQPTLHETTANSPITEEEPIISHSENEESTRLQDEIPRVRNPDRKNTYQEFGDSVNGYKFIKQTGTQENVYRVSNMHSIFEGNSSYHLSYEPVKVTEAVDKYNLEENIRRQEQLEQTYDEYLLKWDNASELEDIRWPNSRNSSDNVTRETLKFFFGEDDMKLWKLERIRWHPDNLIKKFKKLSNDKQSLQRITEVFQLINDIWEEKKSE